MSMRGDLAWLRAAIFYGLDHGSVQLQAEAPQAPWLDWLGVAWSPAPHNTPLEVLPLAFDFDAQELRDRGLLGEVVYGALVQTRWHPLQQDWVARTRSEIAACYSQQDLAEQEWELMLPVLEQLNAYRLQELTPGELIEHSRPFWQGEPDPNDEAMLEAWVLLHFNTFQCLQDVAECLRPFFQPLAPSEWKLPPDMEWPEVEAMLGVDRLKRLTGSLA